ncbi:hypothetical protein [Bacillus swezeyi]
MEHIKILGAPIESSYIGLGTWAISGVMWGETDEAQTGSEFLTS